MMMMMVGPNLRTASIHVRRHDEEEEEENWVDKNISQFNISISFHF